MPRSHQDRARFSRQLSGLSLLLLMLFLVGHQIHAAASPFGVYMPNGAAVMSCGMSGHPPTFTERLFSAEGYSRWIAWESIFQVVGFSLFAFAAALCAWALILHLRTRVVRGVAAAITSLLLTLFVTSFGWPLIGNSILDSDNASRVHQFVGPGESFEYSPIAPGFWLPNVAIVSVTLVVLGVLAISLWVLARQRPSSSRPSAR